MKENAIFDSWTLKAIVIVYFLIMLLVFFGKILMIIEESKPIKRDPWLPRIDLEQEAIKRKQTSKVNTVYNMYTEPWAEDKKQNTENWADFLEKMEDKGLTLSDPEAEDLWEEFK
jgi:hypothetical protein